MEATIGGVRIFYREVGDPSNYPLILLHGGPGLDHMEMYPWHDALGDTFRLIYVDQRGQGRSERVDPSTLSLSLFARDVTDLAAALDLPRYALLGHSFGSFVTLAHAIEQRGASHYIVSGGTASFAKSSKEIEENLAQFEPVELREQVTRSWAMEPEAKTQEDVATLMRMQWPFHYANPESMRRAFARAEAIRPGWQREEVYAPDVLAYFSANEYPIEYEEQLPSITAPTLVMTGEFDRTCTPRASREMHAAIPHSELAIIPDAGHMTFMEQPDLYFAAIRGFFARYPLQTDATESR